MVAKVNWYDDKQNTIYIQVQDQWSMDEVEDVLRETSRLRSTRADDVNVVLHFDTDYVPGNVIAQYPTLSRAPIFGPDSPVNRFIIVGHSRFIRALVDLMERIYPFTSRKMCMVDSLTEADDLLNNGCRQGGPDDIALSA